MNTAEWAFRDGVPYAIDFMNPAPDMDIYSLGEEFYGWCITHLADMCIKLAKNPRPQIQELRWNQLFYNDWRLKDGQLFSVSRLQSLPTLPC